MMRFRSRRAKIVGWTSIAMVAVLVLTAIGAYVALRVQLSGITHVSRIDAKQRPPRYTNALNILLLGSDTRTGANGGDRRPGRVQLLGHDHGRPHLARS